MRVLKTVITRHPKSFDNVHLAVTAVRDVFRWRPNGHFGPDFEIVTSKVITTVQFRARIEEKFGACIHFDQYVDYHDGMEVARGIVVHDGMKKAFRVRFEEMTEDILDDVVSSLLLTTKLEVESL